MLYFPFSGSTSTVMTSAASASERRIDCITQRGPAAVARRRAARADCTNEGFRKENGMPMFTRLAPLRKGIALLEG